MASMLLLRCPMRLSCPALLLAWLLAVPAAAQFSYTPPGDLERPGGGSLREGAGRVDDHVYAPGMRFPIEAAPAYSNSQIYGHGGYMGPGGGQCESANYSYPWHDNYCEERSWTMPLCPSGRGHQGQDIRPATCRDNHYWSVAAADGTITNVGSYSVYLTADDGTRYDYLHMRSVAVSSGQRVTRGQRLGRVSDNMGSTSTTIHLHFNIKQNYSGLGFVFVPTYMSLVQSYRELIGPPDWSAAFDSQSFPFARDPFVLAPGETSTGHISMKNTGGATWRPGEVFLGTTEPRDVSSPLAGPGWVGPNRAATVDRVVAPGEVGRFDFTVQAPMDAGDYPQYFNLVREGVAWFGDPSQGGPPDDQLQVRVTVDPSLCDAPGSCDWLDRDEDGYAGRIDCDDRDATATLGCRCDPSRVPRWAGSDRFATSALVGDQLLEERGASGVVLVNGQGAIDAASDAIVAASLAATNDGPLLLTSSGEMPSATREALARWQAAGVRRAYVVGGAARVPDAQLDELRALGITEVERVSGADRYATSVAAARAVVAEGAGGGAGGGSAVVIASGAGLIDGVSGSALAALRQAPLLLSTPDGLTDEALAFLGEISPEHAFLIGGGVSEQVESQLAALSSPPAVERLSGSDRFETSVAVARAMVGSGPPPSRAFLVASNHYADAVSAAAFGQPLLLSGQSSLAPVVESFLAEQTPRTLVLLGGASVLDRDLEAEACELLQASGPGVLPGADAGPAVGPDGGVVLPPGDGSAGFADGGRGSAVGGTCSCRASAKGPTPPMAWLLAALAAALGLRGRRRASRRGRAFRRGAVGLAVLALWTLLLAAGCGDPEPSELSEPAETSSTRASLDETSSTSSPGIAPPSSLDPSDDPASSADAELLDALTERSRRALAQAPAQRVLLFGAEHLPEAVVTSGPHFYAVSVRDGELTLSIHATDTVHGQPPPDAVIPDAPLTVRGHEARESMNDGIRGLTWSEAGMTYSLEVECYRALEDRRCVEDAFIQSLAEQLETVRTR